MPWRESGRITGLPGSPGLTVQHPQRDAEKPQRAHAVLGRRGHHATDRGTAPARRPWRTTQASTVDLIRRLAAHYDDATIAGVLAREHRRTGTGLTFTKARVAEVRRNYRIPPFRKTAAPACHDGHVVSITQAAAELGVGISTIYRWLADGFIAGEQLTPGAPWRIRQRRDAGQGHRTRPRAGYHCSKPPPPSASPGRPFCIKSNAANSPPCTSAADAAAACVPR